MIEKFLSLSHVKKQVILALLDAFIICLVALISLSIYSTASNFIDNYILLIFISPLLAVSIFIYLSHFAVERASRKKFTTHTLWEVAKKLSKESDLKSIFKLDRKDPFFLG